MYPLPWGIFTSLWLLYQSWPTGHTGPGSVDQCPPALHTWRSTKDPSSQWPEGSVTVSVWMVETQSTLTRLQGKLGLTWSEQHSGMGMRGCCYLQLWVSIPAISLTACLSSIQNLPILSCYHSSLRWHVSLAMNWDGIWKHPGQDLVPWGPTWGWPRMSCRRSKNRLRALSWAKQENEFLPNWSWGLCLLLHLKVIKAKFSKTSYWAILG